jgi:hypothetical protein
MGIPTTIRDLDSVTGRQMRIHVATFDAADGEDYNRENCIAARDLFMGQPSVVVRYWCERGTARQASGAPASEPDALTIQRVLDHLKRTAA